MPHSRIALPSRAQRGGWLERETTAAGALTDGARMRRRVVALVALVVGAAMLAWSLRIPPGDARFIPATIGLAAVWAIGSFAGGRPLWLPAARRDGRAIARDAATGLGVGLALLAVFLLGAGIVAQIAVLRESVEALLAHTHWGAMGAVLAVAVLNGIVEESFFRGALYDAFAGRLAPVVTTLAYTLVTACSGIPLLAFAALVLGAACAMLRRATGGLTAPILAHLSWSTGMILFLDPLLDWWHA